MRTLKDNFSLILAFLRFFLPFLAKNHSSADFEARFCDFSVWQQLQQEICLCRNFT